VRYVLEGSSRKAGNRIRVTAQLVETETGQHLWAERYDRDLADIAGKQALWGAQSIDLVHGDLPRNPNIDLELLKLG
jgi:TolB-like protein